MSDSLQPRKKPGVSVHHQLLELAHHPFSWCCDPVSPSSVIPFSYLQKKPIRVFTNESVLRIRCPKCWRFSLSISPSNEYSGLISFRMDWFGLLAVQGTLKSFLQHHSSKASILQCSAFLTVQLSHPYMTTGKIIALTRWIFVGIVMSLLSNMLPGFVIAFFPRSKCLLILWLLSHLHEPKKRKSVTVSMITCDNQKPIIQNLF